MRKGRAMVLFNLNDARALLQRSADLLLASEVMACQAGKLCQAVLLGTFSSHFLRFFFGNFSWVLSPYFCRASWLDFANSTPSAAIAYAGPSMWAAVK